MCLYLYEREELDDFSKTKQSIRSDIANKLSYVCSPGLWLPARASPPAIIPIVQYVINHNVISLNINWIYVAILI